MSKADWLENQAEQPLELSDEALNEVAGGRSGGVPAGGMDRRINIVRELFPKQ